MSFEGMSFLAGILVATPITMILTAAYFADLLAREDRHWRQWQPKEEEGKNHHG